MRKLLTLSVMAIFAMNSYSQSWMDLGIKGGWGINFLYNKNVLDDTQINEKLSTGYSIGGKLGWNFDDFHEITFDVMYYSFIQNYKYNEKDSVTGGSPEFDRSVSFSGMQFMLLYRHNNDGRYVEIGPSLATMKKLGFTDDQAKYVPTDLDQYKGTNRFGLVFGFGGYLVGTDNFGITMGFRFNYDFSDAFTEDNMHFPAMKNYTTAYTQSHPITAMLVMEANLDFAYMAKAKCKNKRKLILF